MVPRSMGAVSTKVAVGNWSVCTPWWPSWPSRIDSSLASVVRSTVRSAPVSWVPASVMEPSMSGVRPTAVGAAETDQLFLGAVAGP